jgi:ATP/maltotriose-dependent transcriptional regulator MalT
MGVVRAERVLAQLAWGMCHLRTSHRYCLSLHQRLRRLGSTAFQAEIVTAILISVAFGDRTVADVRGLFDELYGEARDAGPLLTASLQAARARLDYVAGVIGPEDARAVLERHAELLRQTGSPVEAMATTNYFAVMYWLEGDDAAAEAANRAQVAEHEALGDRVYVANALATWAASLCRLGEADAALHAVQRGRALARSDDVADQIQLDSAEAYARALTGDARRSEELFERVKTALREIDMVFVADAAVYDEAGALVALGDLAGARAMLERLRDDTEARGRRRWADRYRRDLDALDR